MVEMGNVWDRTTAFLSEHARVLTPVVLAALFVPHTISALVSGAGPAINSAVGNGIALACALVSLWGQLAVVALALDPGRGRAGAVSAATGSIGRAITAMLIGLIFMMILGLPIIVLFGGPLIYAFVANGFQMTSSAVEWSTGAKLFFGVYAPILVIVLLIIAVRLALLYPVIVAEGGVIAAIRRAWVLSRGMVWKMIGVWLLFTIVYLIAQAAVTSAIGTVIGLLTDMRGAFSFGRIIVAILSGGVSTLFTLIVAAFSAMLYRAAIAAREGVAAA